MATYQAQTIAVVDTLAHFQAANQWLGGGFTTCGWTAVGGSTGATSANSHGEVVASGTGATYAWTNTGSVLTTPTTVLAAQPNYVFQGTWVSGGTYVGSNTANAARVDLVTFATAGNTPVTYQKITASSSGATNPPNDTTNWQPCIFEIWKSNGAMTTTNPIYVRIVYTVGSVVAGNFNPRINVSIGSGVDSSGNITGAVSVTTSAPTTINTIGQAAVATVVGQFDCNVSGDADNIRWVGWRGSNQGAPSNMYVMIIDRSKTATGTDSDAFTFVGFCGGQLGAAHAFSQYLLKASLGTPVLQSTAGWMGVITTAGLTSTINVFGTNPALPIFPLVGYVANPLLGAVGFNSTDVSDGGVYPVWLYGSSHNFMAINSQTAAGSTINNVATGVIPAIRWE